MFRMSRKRPADGPLVLNNMDAKHASLVQDYLQLQEEFTALKDRLQAALIKRATVLAEVRFLKRRLKTLKESPTDPKAKESTSTTAYIEKSTCGAVEPDPFSLSAKNKLLRTTDLPISWEPHNIVGYDESVEWKGFNDNGQLVSALKMPAFRNSPNVFATGMTGKRKIYWEDQISLECN